MEEILKEKGYKATAPRLAILKTFIKMNGPLNADTVHQKVTKLKENKNINKATVYRSLLSFEKSGILKKVDLRKSSLYFELAKEHHHHMICTKCERVEDFSNTEIEKSIRRIVEKSSMFKIIQEHSLELFGLCRMCS